MKELRISWLSVVVILAAVAAFAALGSFFSMMNRDWYEGLARPGWQPPNWAFPVAWNTIYILTAISIILVWNTRPRTEMTYWVIGLFLVNGILNVAWSAIFFGNRMILPAVIDSALLFLSVVAIMIAAWRISRTASLLLIPYAVWVGFATYLTWVIYTMNR